MDSTNTNQISYLELVEVGTSDQHKPTYSQLRGDGMSERAIETLMLSRDAMTIMPAAEVAEWIALSHKSYPLSVEDVWPHGEPEHWVPCIVCDFIPALCEGRVCDCGPRPGHPDYDPTDAELAVAWNAPGAHEAHRAAWALAQGIESGQVA